MNFIHVATPETATLHISDGNGKMGRIPYWSINPGEGYHTVKSPKSAHYGETVGNMPGSCGGVCEGCGKCDDGKKPPCYAINDFLRHLNTCGKSWNDNTYLAMKEPARLRSLLNAWLDLNEPRFFRIHEAGEFFSFRYFCMWMDIISAHPETRFYFYTKHSDFLKRYADEVGPLPANCSALVSIWHDTVTNFTGAAEFVYDDGTEEYARYLPHCPAVDCKGRKTGTTCMECKMCMNAKPGDRYAVYAH